MPDVLPDALPPVAAVGAGVAEALAAAGLVVDAAARAVAVGGAQPERLAGLRAAVAAGRHAFAAWPPGTLQEAEALVRDAHEAGVEVGVERPVSFAGGAASRLVTVTLLTDGAAWPRALASALDVCASVAGSREAAHVSAHAERAGAALVAVAMTVRFRNGAFAQALVRTGATPGLTVYAAGEETAYVPADAFADEARAFLRSLAAGSAPPFPLDDALATLRLVERVMDALR